MPAGRAGTGGSPGPCVSVEIEDNGVGGAKLGLVPVAFLPLSFSPHLSRNRVPETNKQTCKQTNTLGLGSRKLVSSSSSTLGSWSRLHCPQDFLLSR